ncbi:MAG: response regulator [Planctomycetota bacterium]
MPNPDNLNLLIVDDDDVDVQAVVRAVRRAGLSFGLFTSRDGDEAMELLRKESSAPDAKPFLVLLDLNMPGKDGFEFLKELRNDKDLSKSVVFILSTSDHESDRERAHEHMVAGYLVKGELAPNYDKLVELISKYPSAGSSPAPPKSQD